MVCLTENTKEYVISILSDLSGVGDLQCLPHFEGLIANQEYRVSQQNLMPFQIQISREFHYGSLSIPIGIQRTVRD